MDTKDQQPEMNDQTLLQQIKAHDPRALSSLYETFRVEFVHWVMRTYRCQREDALEYYQAAVIILYDNIHKGKLDTPTSSLKTYLFGVGKNLVLQGQRQQSRRQQANAEFYITAHVQDDSHDQLLSQDVSLAIISQCFNKMGDPCHTLLDMYYYQQKSMEEISMKLGYKNKDTAKTQKYKCMERLREMVEAELVRQPE